MSLKKSSERVKEIAEEIKQELEGVAENLVGTVPRPVLKRLSERPTILLRQPLIPAFLEKRRRRTK